MNLEVSQYVNKYLENNFKLYYDNLGKKNMLNFLGIISSNSSFRGYTVEEIVVEHKADKIIDTLIEKFVQEKMTVFWHHEVSSYVKEYMQKNHPVYYGVLDMVELDKFVLLMVSNSLFKKYGLTAIINGEANNLIDEAVNSYAQVKLTNVWSNFEFFCDYIKRIVLENEFSNADKVNEVTLTAIVRNIAIDKSKENLVDYSNFMNGSYDKMFVNSFNGYYDRMSRDCLEHIMNVVSNVDKNNYGKYAAEYVLDNVLEIIFKQYDIEEITTGLCDEKIIEEYNAELFKLRVNVKRCIETILNSNLDMDMFNKISFIEVVNSLMVKVLTTDEFNVYHLLSENASKGKYEQIEKKVLSYVYLSAKENEISQYVLNYVKNRYFVYFNELDEGDISKLINILMNDALFKNKTLTQIKDNKFRNKLDDLIEKIVCERFPHVWNTVDTKRYIYDKVESMNFGSLPKDSLMDVAYKIFDILFINHKYTLDYIREGNADNLISSLFTSKVMEYNSIVNKNVPKKIKRKSKKRKMQRNVSMLLVVATLTTFLGLSSYAIAKGFKEGVDDISADLRYNSSSSQMFGDQFDMMYTKYTDGFAVNAESIVNVYNEYNKYGEVYGYLGFYETYKHANDDSLAIMDSMLSKVKNGITNGTYDSNMKINSVYFLDFIYDRLVEMGCEEIQQDKYRDAINEYIRIDCSNYDRDKTTMDIIQEENKELSKLIYEITDLYHQYSSKYYKELYDLTLDNVVSLSFGGRL